MQFFWKNHIFRTFGKGKCGFCALLTPDFKKHLIYRKIGTSMLKVFKKIEVELSLTDLFLEKRKEDGSSEFNQKCGADIWPKGNHYITTGLYSCKVVANSVLASKYYLQNLFQCVH